MVINAGVYFDLKPLIEKIPKNLDEISRALAISNAAQSELIHAIIQSYASRTLMRISYMSHLLSVVLSSNFNKGTKLHVIIQLEIIKIVDILEERCTTPNYRNSGT
ncbi:hypothetical protein RF11_14594 [Thelohanellus kitauei]|uniref:Uncharacterized protein n=1 Tax=Thelohanellus kitauei TaxID=669202 RepID=A0A0C2IZB0_THEKT|nr:hypothetical protein RF11_14594 [Thelohanellus kitauei]